MVISNWKILIAIYIATFGLWGFILKIVSTKLDWKTMMLYVWMTIFIILLSTCFRNINYGLSKFHILAILAGVIAAIGTIAFYKALSLAPASLVIPLSAQYILVTALLCILFLKEPVSPRLILGVICSVVAIMLLAK